MDYYKRKQYIAEVDEKDTIVGKIEKWEAHKKGILHRGFTAILTVGDYLLLQYRKHPVFDNVLDLSFSSHQGYEGDNLQSDTDAVYEGLEREWGIQKKEALADPRLIKKVYYKALDDVSGYTEHEIDYIFGVTLARMPVPNPDFAYGFMTVNKRDITKLCDVRLQSMYAPWVA